jgi:hypothetical protein
MNDSEIMIFLAVLDKFLNENYERKQESVVTVFK